ncbi:hypothetical protein CQW23_02470 [Capsicum baccatum]|uniref:CCHC-type domain-containing protein n=1 Tax=Capsicum baccatum TaxID=33114 RepID=A0A2G2XRI5_CAPBA|nr:hypothetical protein CQW23_02470 [Capsicum baccatum]
MTNVHLMEILYRALNLVTKPVVDNAAGGSFMDLTFNEASGMLDRMTKQSRAWHTRDSKIASSTIYIGMTAEQRQREEESDQDMAYIKTQMDLLTKHLLSGKTEKIKAVSSKGRDESDSEEEANYLNNQGGFRGNAQGNQGRNYYDRSGNKDRDQGSWKDKTDRSGLYVPPGRRDAAASGTGKMSMKDMMAKLVKGVEATNTGVTEVINDLSSMKQLVDSHSTAIKQLEQQMSQLSMAFNQQKAGTLPNDTVQNPRNEGSCMAITTRNGKVLENLPKGKQVVDNIADNDIDVDSEDAVEAGKSGHDVTPTRLQPEKSDNRKQDKKEVVEKTIPLPPPPFPQRLKKKADDTRFSKFMTMLKQLTINVPLVEALEQMPGYAKFMKDLLTKKRAVSYEPADNIHHCSAISTRSLVQKKADPGSFTIPCTVGSMNFAKALCDLGASINLMPLSVYRKLGLGDPTPTNMWLVMADRSVKRPVGILNDVLVKVSTFIFPADFVILDCEVDSEVPIILGRPFLATGSVLIDMRANELLFRLNDEVVRFDICKAMKQPSNMNVFSVDDAYYEDEKELSVEKSLTVVSLSDVLLNFEHEEVEEHEETACALTGIKSYSHAPKKLDLDLMNQPSPTAKTSIEEPPVLESKELPSYLRDVSLGSGNTLPVSVAADLSEQHVEALISALKRNKRVMGWTIDDIIGIPPGICMHKRHHEEDCMPTSRMAQKGRQRKKKRPPHRKVRKEEEKSKLNPPRCKYLDTLLESGFSYLFSTEDSVSRLSVGCCAHSKYQLMVSLWYLGTNMPPKKNGRRTGTQPAPQPIQADPLDEYVSHIEFRVAFTTLSNSIEAHNKQPAAIPDNPVANIAATKIWDFTRMNSPSFTGSKSEEDPQEFLDMARRHRAPGSKSQVSISSARTNSLCQKYGRHYQGKCRAGSNMCFRCGKPGHQIRECRVVSQKGKDARQQGQSHQSSVPSGRPTQQGVASSTNSGQRPNRLYALQSR